MYFEADARSELNSCILYVAAVTPLSLLVLPQVICATKPPIGYRHSQILADTRRLAADQLRTQPENFFDMRQAKRTDKSPDFKHKFSKQGLWLNTAPTDLVALVQQWDTDKSEKLPKVCCLVLLKTSWHHLFCAWI